MFLLQEFFTDLRLHFRNKTILRLHQSTVNLPRHICCEIAIQLCYLINHNLLNSHLISRIFIVPRSVVGQLHQGILHALDYEDHSCYLTRQSIIDKEIAAHILVLDVLI